MWCDNPHCRERRGKIGHVSPLPEVSPITGTNREKLSAVSSEAALRRPLSEIVEAALESAASRSRHTTRAYRTAIGLFLQFLDRSKGKLLPEELSGWRPFAASYDLDSGGKMWKFSGPGAVLRLVDGGVLAGFKASRERAGDSVNTIAQRIPAVRTFLSVAYRDGVLTHEQAQSLGISIYRLRLKRDIRPVGRRLSNEEVAALQAAIPVDTVKGRRDLAIIDTMLYLGLRREEITNLRLADFRLDRGSWWLIKYVAIASTFS